ncbi:MAG: RNA-binding protein [Lachnospiraceae bacterium]|jgi:RNA-binding protein YlmH|nr:RNA-binding protein [Lachnospiraceae bacterium]
MNKDEGFLRKRFIDLSNQAYYSNRPVFSNFLGLNELNILHTTDKSLFPCGYRTFGGMKTSERQMAVFTPDAFTIFYPFAVAEITPKYPKFAESLNHRDYLGSLMGMGIKREKLGDIILNDNKTYVFIHNDILNYLLSDFKQVKHTLVNIKIIRDISRIKFEEKFTVIKGNVSSLRLDSILSEGFKLSRKIASELISSSKVFVNGKLILSNGYNLKEEDIISARGFGRLEYVRTISLSKKGRLFVEIHKY